MDKVRCVCVCLCVSPCVTCVKLSHGRLSGLQSAGTFDEVAKPSSSYQKTQPVEAGECWAPSAVFQSQPEVVRRLIASSLCLFLISRSTAGSGTGSIKARFENIAKQKEEEDRKKAEEERARRQAKEKQEQEEARRKAEERAKTPSPVPASSPSPTPPAQPAVVPVHQVGQAGLAPAAAAVRVGFPACCTASSLLTRLFLPL